VEFQSFAERLRRGESSASEELLQRYARRLRAIASRRVGCILRSKFDTEDVLQSVFGSFFAEMRSGKISVTSSHNLRGLLALMVTRKCARYAERYSSLSRDYKRESSAEGVGNNSRGSWEIHDSRPLPDEIVAQADAWNMKLGKLPPLDRQVVESFMLGDSTSEIALRMRCSSRTIQRILRRACIQFNSHS
jgi:RNA polymerase sigma factor (sigma-70 family)